MIHHLAPGGLAGLALTNGSMPPNQPGGGQIRKAMAETDLVGSMVAVCPRGPTQNGARQ